MTKADLVSAVAETGVTKTKKEASAAVDAVIDAVKGGQEKYEGGAVFNGVTTSFMLANTVVMLQK